MTIVSACLAGIPCRYNHDAIPNETVIALVKEGKALPLCPEQLGGLTTPREPSEIIGDCVVSKTGVDVTNAFREGAKIVLDIALRCGCTDAILKSNSPSCGSGTIYDGTFSGATKPGDGVTARLLKENGIRVMTEQDAYRYEPYWKKSRSKKAF